MDRALYLAMSGGTQVMNAQGIHANNLANVATTGFRADFEQARSMQVNGDYYPSRVYAMTENPGTRMERGVMIETGRDMDVAIQGDGFIAAMDATGQEVYTRAGDLQLTSAGQLVTGTGLPVLGSAGPVFLPPLDALHVGSDGTISFIPQGGDATQTTSIGRIKLVNTDGENLTKGNDGLLRTKNGLPLDEDNNIKLISGFLEGSNVNAVEEMTEIMELARRFEMNIKVMDSVRQNATASAKVLER
ncbi:flagellar basal-body rod protein FlgF [Marinomonas mediterranea]|jgi:flagellar basal-body rod protein FlgF|uniref:Flagellar basal-body rod protein FlgF n=1 Tax=Marinomonas mediterranea (strain ATCC 700492 / JCM 21426 / NBRC 103028 / MMB-1) TaxID=717774 RepID=F2K4T7_MARM1|nr:flagellar basal-body rod protein FlgF [Marinomonas mediterranea]ADZ92580.1 flagellar basal-body rod protein FlgF [Marinomonas mediterranea MMB-1]WCN10523.1 flagellar basal-body rod protein FlgF [Marinomonas mediterranea]WCN14573.1 flagellar basal-body rod protein FlgF [Marinomonas mediterranea]WCN18622.1 flagellar basal-body rod protein FlgF [Marinomonas mediterranea MMB-1]